MEGYRNREGGRISYEPVDVAHDFRPGDTAKEERRAAEEVLLQFRAWRRVCGRRRYGNAGGYYGLRNDINDIPAATVKTAVGVDWGDTSWAVVRRGNYILHMEQITGATRTHPRRVAELMEKFNGHAVCDFGYGDTKNKALIENSREKYGNVFILPK